MADTLKRAPSHCAWGRCACATAVVSATQTEAEAIIITHYFMHSAKVTRTHADPKCVNEFHVRLEIKCICLLGALCTHTHTQRTGEWGTGYAYELCAVCMKMWYFWNRINVSSCAAILFVWGFALRWKPCERCDWLTDYRRRMTILFYFFKTWTKYN